MLAIGFAIREAKNSTTGRSNSAMTSRESASVLFSACMPSMISVMDCAIKTAPMTSPMKAMGTATTTSLPFISSSVESEVSADLLLSAVRPLIALFVLPDLR